MTRCILFDNDGTLVDSEQLCFRTMAGMFAAFGVQLDERQLVRDFRGRKLEETLATLGARYGIDLPERFIPDYRRQVEEAFSKDLRPVPGVVEVLESLPQDKAVVSSGPMAKIRHALAVTGLERFFGDRVYSSYEVGIWKPDPGIYLHAMADMDYRVEDCLAVEDSPAGVAAAAGSGARTVFLDRFDEQCARDGVIVIRSMTELPGVI